MLSFDFSDKQIKVVKGEFVGGKIRLIDAMLIDVPEGVIINGFIQELPKLVAIVNERLRDNRFNDKEALVSISSSQIVFRELNVPKAKGAQLFSMIQNQIQRDMNITDGYNISYTIVGETKENNSVVNRVLAAVCPNDMIIGIKRLFNMISLPVKSISVSCNSISRIVLADNRNKERMPLLAIQIDNNFLNLNLYENNQLAFSRVVPIERADYDSDDYIYQALNENVFRMIQFNKARGGNGIKDVIFYGNVSDYIKLTRSIEQQDVKTHILSVPNQIVGYEKFEFAIYANAIGAMLKGKRELERTNLLEIESSAGRDKATSGFFKTLIVTFVLSGIIAAGGYFAADWFNNKALDELETHNSFINSSDTKKKLEQVNSYETAIQANKKYFEQVDAATDSLTSRKVLKQTVFDVIRKKIGLRGEFKTVTYKDNIAILDIIVSGKADPADIVEALAKSGEFNSVHYEGFEVISTDLGGKKTDNVHFKIVIALKAGGK